MKNPETLVPVYEELADRFAEQKQLRQRDHCLVMAADTALAAGWPEEAERLRQRLLGVNPHHLLRPYASMADAVRYDDIKEYLADIRRQWPPDLARRLYDSGPPRRETESAAWPVRVEPRPETALPRKTHVEPLHLGDPPELLGKPVLPVEGTPTPLEDEPPTAPPPKKAPPVLLPTGPRPVSSPYEPPPLPPRPASTEVTPPLASWLATMLFFLGVLLTLAIFILAFVWPLLD